jgi:GNAT superfamily N-acetyltransferase
VIVLVVSPCAMWVGAGVVEATVRRATVVDLPTLVALRLHLFRAMAVAGDLSEDGPLAVALAEYFASAIPTERFYGWLACDPAGAAIGCGGLVFLQRPPSPGHHSGREAYVMNMYTAPAWRGRGLAGQILAQILGFVRDSGVTVVRLHATAQGRPIYERAGFEAVGTEMVLTLQ